jgi:ankyrin repeat protein
VTPLHGASASGHLEVVKALLGAEADVNKADKSGWTPLHCASNSGHLEVVQTLLGAEADVNKADNYRRTSLSLALECNRHRVAAVLREAGAHEPH